MSWRTRVRTRHVAAGAVVLVLLVIMAGLIPIRASSRHWAVTSWILDFIKRRSVATQSIGVEAPPLDAPALVSLGAAHFEGVCQPCHGRPGGSLPPVPTGMTPHPPDLRPQIARWSPEELFSIVRHGIKFTGMPAWPAATRDDEVWAVVAFLRALPALDDAGYRALVRGGTPSPVASASQFDTLVATCARCHGEFGEGRAGVPRLAGQREAYLSAALRAYASGMRHSGFMTPVAAHLDAATVLRLARVYSAMSADRMAPVSTHVMRDRQLRSEGETIALRGVPSRQIPACASCHGPSVTTRNPEYPGLSGQQQDYLMRQLELFQQGRRGGTAHADIMRPIAARLSPMEMAAVARFYAEFR